MPSSSSLKKVDRFKDAREVGRIFAIRVFDDVGVRWMRQDKVGRAVAKLQHVTELNRLLRGVAGRERYARASEVDSFLTNIKTASVFVCQIYNE